MLTAPIYDDDVDDKTNIHVNFVNHVSDEFDNWLSRFFYAFLDTFRTPTVSSPRFQRSQNNTSDYRIKK